MINYRELNAFSLFDDMKGVNFVTRICIFFNLIFWLQKFFFNILESRFNIIDEAKLVSIMPGLAWDTRKIE